MPFTARSTTAPTTSLDGPIAPLFVPPQPSENGAAAKDEPALLGRDFLSHWTLLLDLRGGRLELHPHPDVPRIESEAA